MRSRLLAAMLAYLFLAVLAGLTLDQSLPVADKKVPLRILVWIVLAGFAVKSWVADRMQR